MLASVVYWFLKYTVKNNEWPSRCVLTYFVHKTVSKRPLLYIIANLISM